MIRTRSANSARLSSLRFRPMEADSAWISTAKSVSGAGTSLSKRSYSPLFGNANLARQIHTRVSADRRGQLCPTVARQCPTPETSQTQPTDFRFGRRARLTGQEHQECDRDYGHGGRLSLRLLPRSLRTMRPVRSQPPRCAGACLNRAPDFHPASHDGKGQSCGVQLIDGDGRNSACAQGIRAVSRCATA